MSRFKEAKGRYEALGIDVEAALAKLAEVAISIHCWHSRTAEKPYPAAFRSRVTTRAAHVHRKS